MTVLSCPSWGRDHLWTLSVTYFVVKSQSISDHVTFSSLGSDRLSQWEAKPWEFCTGRASCVGQGRVCCVEALVVSHN